MARGLKFSSMFFILLVSLQLCSMLYLTAEARPLNGQGLAVGQGAGAIEGASKKTTSGFRVARRTKEDGPSPGAGHHH